MSYIENHYNHYIDIYKKAISRGLRIEISKYSTQMYSAPCDMCEKFLPRKYSTYIDSAGSSTLLFCSEECTNLWILQCV